MSGGWYWLDENNQVCGPADHYLDDPRVHVGWGGEGDPARLRETAKREPHGIRPCGWERVAFTEIAEGCEVSTVFIGLDHRFSDTGPPLVFETMAFWGIHWIKPFPEPEGENDPYAQLRKPYDALYERHKDTPFRTEFDSERYSTWAEAEAGHQRMVEKLIHAVTVERDRQRAIMRGEIEEPPGTAEGSSE